MKISCESCAAKYTIADEKVAGKVVKIKCKKCGATIVVDGNAPQATDPSGYGAPNPGGYGGYGGPAAEAASFDDNAATQMVSQNHGQAPLNPDEWTVSITDDDQRTMTTDQIIAGYQAGAVPGEAFVWREGMGDWLPLTQVPDLASRLGAPPQPQQQYSPQQVAAQQVAPQQQAQYAQQAQPVAAAAARKAGGRGSGVDLFGGGGAPPAPSGAGHTGERNENSVLFSLSALKGLENAAAPKKPPKPAKSNDRVEDIFALGSNEPLAPPSLLAAPSMIAPVVEPPPPPRPVMDPGYAAGGYGPQSQHPNSFGPGGYAAQAAGGPNSFQQEKKGAPVGIIIGGVVAVLAIAAGVFFFVIKGSGDKDKTASADTSSKSDTGTKSPSKSGSSGDSPAGNSASPSSTGTAAVASNDDTKQPDDGKTDSPSGDDTSNPSTPGNGSGSTTTPGGKKVGTDKRPDDKKPDDKKPDDKKPDDKKPDDKKPDDKKPDDTPGNANAEFDRGAAMAALSGRAGSASGCKKGDGPTGSAKVQVTFAPSGHATQATVGAPFAGTPTGSCIAGAFSGLSVPPFSGSAVTVSKTVSIH